MHVKKIIFFLIPCFSLGGCEEFVQPEPATDAVSLSEDLWKRFNEEYAPFEERSVVWETQYNQYRPMVNENTSDEELFTILTALLRSLNDGHVSLTSPGRKIFFSNKILNDLIDDSLFQLEVIQGRYLESGYKNKKDSYLYGKIKKANLGYIFFDHVGENFFILQNFFEEYKEVEGYIIDLRHNQGGDFTYAFSELGQLTKERQYVFRSKTKNGSGKSDYTPWHSWYIEPRGIYLDKPLVVLTDRYTISAGERAVMAFKTLPQVTVMGDTTNGAHGTMIGRELANGWFYSLVPQKVELFDGKSYEGEGLAPDIYVKNRQEEIATGIDNVLEQAIEKLN